MTQSYSAQQPWRRRLCAVLSTRPRAASALPLLGIALGIALALAAAFRQAPPAVGSVPPGYVALVNQRGILMSDFINQTEMETEKKFADTTPAERQSVLQAMVDEELLVQRGLVLDLPETTIEVRDALTKGVNAQVDAPLLELQPSDAQLRAYYNAHLSAYTSGGTMTLRDLLLRFGGYQDSDQSEAQADSDARDAVYQLRSGASIEYVMEHYGFVDSGRVDNGAQLDFAAKIHLRDRLYAVAATLADGEISEPVADTDGLHVLVMGRRQPPTITPFSSARDKVYQDYRRGESARAEAGNLGVLRAQAQILLAPVQGE